MTDLDYRISVLDILQLLEDVADDYPESVFPEPGPNSTPDAYSAHAIRFVLQRLENEVKDLAVRLSGEGEKRLMETAACLLVAAMIVAGSVLYWEVKTW